MANSINTNIAAYYAQGNINLAAQSSSTSVARLSSGNRIVRASDDVAALSAGTGLRTNVTTLRTALVNASQASSLLQVADGALSQVTDILQRQKAIAVQAGSGSLDTAARSYLNQEFQNLTQEIDRIAGSTNFNGVNLINGTLSGSASIGTNTADSAATSLTSAAQLLTIANGVPVNGDIVTIQGVQVTFTTATPGQASAAGKVTIGNNIANTAANLAAFLNNLGDPHFANLEFVATATGINARYTGGVLGGTLNLTASSTFATPANGVAANTTIAAGGAAGLGIDRYSTSGTVGGRLLVTSGATAQLAGSAIDVSTLEDNAAFLGKLGEGLMGKIEGTYANADDTGVFSLKVGDITYSTGAVDITNAGNVVALAFTGKDSTGATKGGSFTLNINGNALTAAGITSQSTLDPIVAELNDSLKDVSFFQNRDINSLGNGGVVNLGGTQIANLTGFSVDMRSDNFTNMNIESIKVTAPGIGSTDAKIEMVVNGETYTSLAGIGNQLGLTKVVALQNTSDPSKVISLVTGATAIPDAATVSVDLSSSDKAASVQAALENMFGLSDSSSAKLSFQIGVKSSDNLGVKIGGVTADALGISSLKVTDQTSAAAAADALDAALGVVTAVRADVGALQSRFNFASANIESSIQNQDAARGTLLDTDIAAESTNYATNQVKLQAGISVLAQANQQLQNLLKLIG